MGIYSTYIFPKLMNLGMADKKVTPYRKKVLSAAKGDILEIGFGTGLNLPYYPEEVKKITTVDVNAGMNSLAMKNIKNSSVKVEYHIWMPKVCHLQTLHLIPS